MNWRPEETGSSARPGVRTRVLILTLKAALIVAVLWALGEHLLQLLREWNQHGETLAPILDHWVLLVGALVSYAFAQVAFGLVWERILRHGGHRSSVLNVLAAYSVGLFGKYVPGKALVPVLRTELLRNRTQGRLTIALSVVFDSLAMTATGALVAAVSLIAVPQGSTMFIVAPAVAFIVLIVCLQPTFFGRFSRFITIPFRSNSAHPDVKTWHRTFWRFSLVSVFGWLLEGASCLLMLQAVYGQDVSINDSVLVLGGVTLATVTGFVVLFMPAGIGVREVIIIRLFSPRFGHTHAVIISLLVRLVWTLSEVAVGALLYVLSKIWDQDHSATIASANLAEDQSVPIEK